jgi:chemotaxis protein MotA
MLSTGFDTSSVLSFVDLPSIMITFGGTVSCLFIAFPASKVKLGLRAFGKIFLSPRMDPAEAIASIIRLANIARKEGVLSLEEAVQGTNNQFLVKGIMLTVDGADPDLVKNILETEMSYIEGRHADAQNVWAFISAAGPAWGMVGTLIGFVMMLGNIGDPELLGNAMALAVTATFYGVLIAHFIANPVINKLKAISAEEIYVKEILVEGILSVQSGENPRITEEKLKSYLAPALRGMIGRAEDKWAGVE